MPGSAVLSVILLQNYVVPDTISFTCTTLCVQPERELPLLFKYKKRNRSGGLPRLRDVTVRAAVWQRQAWGQVLSSHSGCPVSMIMTWLQNGSVC